MLPTSKDTTERNSSAGRIVVPLGASVAGGLVTALVPMIPALGMAAVPLWTVALGAVVLGLVALAAMQVRRSRLERIRLNGSVETLSEELKLLRAQVRAAGPMRVSNPGPRQVSRAPRSR